MKKNIWHRRPGRREREIEDWPLGADTLSQISDTAEKRDAKMLFDFFIYAMLGADYLFRKCAFFADVRSCLGIRRNKPICMCGE